jgi:hypothetical protein
MLAIVHRHALDSYQECLPVGLLISRPEIGISKQGVKGCLNKRKQQDHTKPKTKGKGNAV